MVAHTLMNYIISYLDCKSPPIKVSAELIHSNLQNIRIDYIHYMAIPPLYIVVGLCSKESGYDKELLANKN